MQYKLVCKIINKIKEQLKSKPVSRKFDIRLCCATNKGAKSFLMGWGFPGNCRGASTSVQRQTKVPPDKFNPEITSCRKPRPEDLS
ncbi:hypothetical protein KQX54_005517 [Cotesia glomerata]|uniref:Uncharacterized protein n=1 Tax=Cotesia glomerata TaxID=32391 RepID=A0AAV7HSI1_COTGL|nr:hypothetical protein KQX54_005517 [Cotesia glomerata]